MIVLAIGNQSLASEEASYKWQPKRLGRFTARSNKPGTVGAYRNNYRALWRHPALRTHPSVDARRDRNNSEREFEIGEA